MRIKWTRPALEDLADIQEYISRENPAAARAVGRTIRASTQRLTTHPYSGRTGQVQNTRELVVPRQPFVLAYRVTDVVEILAIRHDAQEWPDTV